MERKEIPKFACTIIVLVIIAYFPAKVLYTETEPNLQLLAIGIILTIVLGGWNMLQSLFRSAEAKALEKANNLDEERYNKQYQNAKNQLKSYLKDFVSCCETSEGNRDKFQKKMSEKRNELKRVVREIEGQLILPQDILNEVKAIASESTTFSSKGSGAPVVGTTELSTLINQQSRGRIAGRDELIGSY
jgi:hypothetical protein